MVLGNREFLGFLYNDIKKKVSLLGIVIRKVEIIFSNQLEAATTSLNYYLFLTNMPETLCSCVHKTLQF